MNTFEDRLLTSLNAEDEAFLKELEQDAGLFQQMGMTFTGPLRYWTAFAFIFSLKDVDCSLMIIMIRRCDEY